MVAGETVVDGEGLAVRNFPPVLAVGAALLAAAASTILTTLPAAARRAR
jgi:hypothetical protein